MTNPFLDPNYPLDIVEGKILYGKDVTIQPKQTAPTTQPEPMTIPTSVYNELVIEKDIPYTDNNKELLTYDASLARLRAKKFERHLRPNEAMELLIDNLESKLNGDLKAVADNMVTSYGEWLSAAFGRSGNVLSVYFDPKNLVWDKSNYTAQGGALQHSGKKDFDITDIASGAWVDLKNFPDELVKLLYGRSFEKLPPVMKTGNLRAQLYLPTDGIIRPVGRGGGGDGYCIVTICDWASRGARKNSTGNKG